MVKYLIYPIIKCSLDQVPIVIGLLEFSVCWPFGLLFYYRFSLLPKSHLFFKVILAVLTSWFICAVLTWTGLLSEEKGSAGYAARVDTKIDVILQSPWIRIPYPCKLKVVHEAKIRLLSSLAISLKK